MIHDFQQSLAKSHAQADAPWWEDVYKEAFPSMVGMRSVRADGWAQRGGIDRLVDLRDGTSIKVDEKVRYEVYEDILLEVWSDRDRQKPGWIKKDLTCDYIAYAFVPTQMCYLLPFQLLKRAFEQNREDWHFNCQHGIDGFRIVEASNHNYVTQSAAIPIAVLLNALKEALVVRWATPDQQEDW